MVKMMEVQKDQKHSHALLASIAAASGGEGLAAGFFPTACFGALVFSSWGCLESVETVTDPPGVSRLRTMMQAVMLSHPAAQQHIKSSNHPLAQLHNLLLLYNLGVATMELPNECQPWQIHLHAWHSQQVLWTSRVHTYATSFTGIRGEAGIQQL